MIFNADYNEMFFVWKYNNNKSWTHLKHHFKFTAVVKTLLKF